MPSSILQGAGFINVYSNPVISFDPVSARANKIKKRNKHEGSNLILPDIGRRELNELDDGPATNYISAGHSKERSPHASQSPAD